MNESSGPWWREVDAAAWKSLWAAGTGWMLDAMDVTLYLIALESIAQEFALDKAQSGLVASSTLIASAIGGIVSGVLADRFGRVRMLMISILCYSVFTALTATAHGLGELLFWRVLVGLGMGGEWSAGAVLVAETWPARHRGKAIGLMQSGWAIGYILAAGLGAAILPVWGWRALFAVGVVPALLVAWIRRGVAEPRAWREQDAREPGARGGLGNALAVVVRPPYLGRAIIATATTTALLFSYWGLFSWVPTYLASPPEAGGAGLGVVKSAAWIVPMQVGAFFGYTTFGFLGDRFGRRRTFIVFVLCAAVIVPIYGASARSTTTLMVLGPLVGFFGHGYFSVFGAMLAELFPTSARGTVQGMCYNLGRGFAAVAPWVIGLVAGKHGLGWALGMTSLFYVLGAGLSMLLPETRGKELA